MKISKTSLGVLAFLGALASTPACFASEMDEADALNRLIQQLEASKSLIDEAKSNHNPDKRLQFDYEALEANITELQRSILMYLQTPQEPKDFEAIVNEYSSYKAKEK